MAGGLVPKWPVAKWLGTQGMVAEVARLGGQVVVGARVGGWEIGDCGLWAGGQVVASIGY